MAKVTQSMGKPSLRAPGDSTRSVSALKIYLQEQSPQLGGESEGAVTAGGQRPCPDGSGGRRDRTRPRSGALPGPPARAHPALWVPRRRGRTGCPERRRDGPPPRECRHAPGLPPRALRDLHPFSLPTTCTPSGPRGCPLPTPLEAARGRDPQGAPARLASLSGAGAPGSAGACAQPYPG